LRINKRKVVDREYFRFEKCLEIPDRQILEALVFSMNSNEFLVFALKQFLEFRDGPFWPIGQNKLGAPLIMRGTHSKPLQSAPTSRKLHLFTDYLNRTYSAFFFETLVSNPALKTLSTK
jgi:hypothetical protein